MFSCVPRTHAKHVCKCRDSLTRFRCLSVVLPPLRIVPDFMDGGDDVAHLDSFVELGCAPGPSDLTLQGIGVMTRRDLALHASLNGSQFVLVIFSNFPPSPNPTKSKDKLGSVAALDTMGEDREIEPTRG